MKHKNQSKTSGPGSLHPGDGRLADLKRTADKAWERDRALTERLNALRRERNAVRKEAWEMTRLYEAALESPIAAGEPLPPTASTDDKKNV